MIIARDGQSEVKLHGANLRAMVRARAQFYWADDLLRATPLGSNNELTAFRQK